MLQNLSIQNYALIDKIDIDFPKGLSIITGETGSGKSILLGALSLITGNRADSSYLRDKTKKCVVEAVFNIKNYPLKDFFVINDLDYAEQTVLRREVSVEGKSRAFINDIPVNLSQLRELSLHLVDIHSQHETLTLNESGYQLSAADAFSKIQDRVSEYKAEYKKYKSEERTLNEMIEKEKRSKLDADYWQFQFKEFEDADLRAGEQEEIENELKVLNNAEEIKSVLLKSSVLLNGSESNILLWLSEIKTLLSGISTLNPFYAELLGRINTAYIELKDIASEIESAEEKTICDPSRIKQLSDRIDLIYRLQKKHQANSVEELLEVMRRIDDRIRENTSLEKQISKLQSETEKKRLELFRLAKAISSARQKHIPEFENEVTSLLLKLGMPNAQFRVEHILLEQLTEQGIDKIKFVFSANKGGKLEEISKVASGGELSRLMLSIKALIVKNTALPTILFDEIDAGVSGMVAEQVGRMINKMADSAQVIAITHLPQIASKGNSHFTVFKEESKYNTVTLLKLLSKEERVVEIAKMLSAGKPTEVSVKNAKELLNA